MVFCVWFHRPREGRQLLWWKRVCMKHSPWTDQSRDKELGGIATQTQSIVTPSMQGDQQWKQSCVGGSTHQTASSL